jgi:hypothetical protein
MKLRAMATMQLWHLAMLAMLPLLFAGFRMVSEPYDPSRALVENVVLLGGVVFSSYSLIFIVITGKSTDALPSLLKLYRDSLSRLSFLATTNVMLTLILALLVYQLIFFRQVEFLSSIDVEIYLGDTVGKPARLAFVRAKSPTYLRLSAGQHHLAVKDMATQQWVESQTAIIPSYFTEQAVPSVWINPRIKYYEKLD